MADDGSNRFIIPSGGGAGGKGGSSKGGGVNETPNTLRSRQVAKIIDLLGEGVIQGLHDGMRSVIFDTIPVMNTDGSYNVKGFAIEYTTGSPDQLPLTGFPSVQQEISVGVQIKTTTPHSVRIDNADTDRVRITMTVPSLTRSNDAGEIKGSAVTFSVWIQCNGGGYKKIDGHTIEGKTTSQYARSLTYNLKAQGPAPWDIRVVRETKDSTSVKEQNDLFWASYAELIDARIRYRNSAIVGISVDAEQFSSIPQRVYDVDGLLIRVPINYNPDTGVYSGPWNGTFKTDFSSNPAWVLYDLITNNRYGIGDYITPAEVDKWSFYTIAQWCDVPVPDGKGGNERRWIFNGIIGDRQEAFDLLAAICSAFRGSHYWAGGLLTAIADKQPADPVGQYTNANVERGDFTYAGSDRRARHTQAAVHWNDPTNLGQPKVNLIDDQDGIARYGLNRVDVTAVGCTSEGQAIRIGKWTLYSELYETETVSFTVGLEGAWCRPGDIIQISDLTVAGERRGGRLVAATTTQLTLDAPVTFHELTLAKMSCLTGAGDVETVDVIIPALDTPVLVLDLVAPGFSEAPLPDTIWVLSTGDINPSLWRVVSISEQDHYKFEISALTHNPGKWGYVERDLILPEFDITNIGKPTISGLTVREFLVALSSVSVGAMVNLSWQSTAPLFDVEYRPENGLWVKVRANAMAIDIPVSAGIWEFRVTPVNMTGFRGNQAALRVSLAGLLAPPATPIRLRAQILGAVLHLQWAASPDLDVVIGGYWELRYSPNTAAGVTWLSSIPVIMAIPGSATTVELPHRAGTYLLKAKDSSGVYSKDPAIIISQKPDSDSRNFVRIQENDAWDGVKANVEVKHPQEALILGTTGGLWDDVLEDMDTWPDVDVLPYSTPPEITFGENRTGTYDFDNRIDLGGVFTTVLTVEMLAFPYFLSQPFIDERTDDVDSWTSWDDAAEDATGQVMIRVRQTDIDPLIASPTDWTAFQPFVSGEYLGRAFEFQAVLTAPYGEQVMVESLAVTADLRAKADHGEDITWTGSRMHFNYAIKFYLAPSITVQIQNALAGDYTQVVNKTRTGFDLDVRNSAGALVTGRTPMPVIDWQAQGF